MMEEPHIKMHVDYLSTGHAKSRKYNSEVRSRHYWQNATHFPGRAYVPCRSKRLEFKGEFCFDQVQRSLTQAFFILSIKSKLLINVIIIYSYP